MNFVSRESAAFAWLVLFCAINAYWIGYDIWAWRTGHRTMTNQFQRWLHEAIAGPLIFGLTVGIVGVFMYHMLVKAAK